MAKVTYSAALRQEYINLYKTMQIKLNKLSRIENHVDQIIKKKSRYTNVGDPLGIPWFFIALIHTMESNRNFSRHLHNGDPLTKRTTHVPSGRPRTGTPPFTWEESATDALRMKKLQRETDWSLPKFLYHLENYNGWGYRLYHPHVLSPYLWSYCNHYISGKYIADGRFSDTAVSKQSGAAVILRRMEQRGVIPAFQLDQPTSSFFKLSNSVQARAHDLQKFLNSFDGISLLVDGKPGKKTSSAVKQIFGHYLRGDRRKK